VGERAEWSMMMVSQSPKALSRQDKNVICGKLFVKNASRPQFNEVPILDVMRCGWKIGVYGRRWGKIVG
jgi:hypothetical protein